MGKVAVVWAFAGHPTPEVRFGIVPHLHSLGHGSKFLPRLQWNPPEGPCHSKLNSSCRTDSSHRFHGNVDRKVSLFLKKSGTPSRYFGFLVVSLPSHPPKTRGPHQSVPVRSLALLALEAKKTNAAEDGHDFQESEIRWTAATTVRRWIRTRGFFL